MSTGLIAIILAAFFVIAIVIGFTKNANTGVLGLFFAIILCCFILQGSYSTVISMFPTKIVLALISVPMFFGYHMENGTVEWLAKKIMYAFRNRTKLLPFAIFIVSFIIGALGGPSSVAFTAALAFPIGWAAGMNAAHVGLCTLLGVQVGANLPIAQFGATAIGLIEEAGAGAYDGLGTVIGMKVVANQFIGYVVVMIAAYFFFRSYKLKAVTMEKPGKANKSQKISLVLILIVLLLLIVPALMKNIVGGTVWKNLANWFDVAPTCFLGSVFCYIFKIADEATVIKKRIPWNAILMVGGMATLINLGAKYGVLDLITAGLSNVPQWLLVPLMCLFAGILSLFSSSLSVVFPTMLPIAAGLATSLGINPIPLFSAVIAGSLTTALSPLSAGGSLVYAACPQDYMSQTKLFPRQFGCAFGSLIILVICCLCGLFSIIQF